MTKSDKQITIYIKNHQIHVKKNQECHVLKIAKSNVKNHPEQKFNVKNQPGFGVLGVWGGNWGMGGELIN